MTKICLSLAILVSVFVPTAWAGTQLLLIGGGNHPPEAISRFVSSAGSAQAKILVISWATDFPEDAVSAMNAELRAVANVDVREAPRRPLTKSTRDTFLADLKNSTAVYFTGGDQNKIMSVIVDPTVRLALYQFYLQGHVVAGTSAGTAIMSMTMLTGVGSQTKLGLGLLTGVLVDTHFLVRDRLPRLQAALRRSPWLIGLGIDQDNAIWVKDNREVEVYGPTELTLVRDDLAGSQIVRNYRAGDKFDLW